MRGPMPDPADHAAEQKSRLAELRTARGMPLGNLEHAEDLELTYTSNAIEGNTLTAAETTLVVEQGITIAGKSLREHLEAVDLFEATRYVRQLARHTERVTEMDIRALHRLVMLRSAADTAGRYAIQGRYVVTERGRHAFPMPPDVPPLMGAFAAWLATAAPSPATAFAAHRRLVDIHPFDDGNGRTARLLMNLALIRAGYPPVAVRPQDRSAYLAALQAGARSPAFDALLFTRLHDTLDTLIQEALRA